MASIQTPPRTYDDLQQTLQLQLGSLSPGQRRIALEVLGDPEDCAFLSITDLAQRAGVHESSLVRFAASLGLPGYPGLVALCRQALRDRLHLVQRFERAQALGQDSEDFLAAMTNHEQQNIVRTIARLDPNVWRSTVSVLAHAPRVQVIGQRKCFAVAHLLTYLLRMVRADVHQVGMTSGLLVEELRDFRPDDAFVAISVHRYAADVLTAVRHAHSSGLSTIVLTDNPASPLVQHTQLPLYVDDRSVTIFRSVTAFMTVVQALVTATALALGYESRESLRRDDDLLEQLGVYVDGSAPRPTAGGEEVA